MILWWQSWSNWFMQKVLSVFFKQSFIHRGYKILSTPATQVWRLLSFHQRCLSFFDFHGHWHGFLFEVVSQGRSIKNTMWVNQKPPIGHFVEFGGFTISKRILQIESNWTKHPKRIKHETPETGSMRQVKYQQVLAALNGNGHHFNESVLYSPSLTPGSRSLKKWILAITYNSSAHQLLMNLPSTLREHCSIWG